MIDDRFPAIFELRRLFFPKFERLSDGDHYDQGIAGFLDHIQKANFQAFIEQTEMMTGRPVIQIERMADDGSMTLLDGFLVAVDTIVVISFDSLRTGQAATVSRDTGDRSFPE